MFYYFKPKISLIYQLSSLKTERKIENTKNKSSIN